ncbi:unnamed protein product, partial [Closterium sp. NIES-53]
MVVEAEARVTAADSAFDNNTFSGILFQGFSQGVLQNCSFTGNSNAAGRGGAVLVGDKTTVAVHSCRFSGNWAALGGAVSTEGSPYLTINGSDFTRNIAQIGAGVALAGATAFTMGESVFIKNNATKAGGGVAVLEQVEGEISGSRFEGNYAVVGGAGVYLMRSAAATTAPRVVHVGTWRVVAYQGEFGAGTIEGEVDEVVCAPGQGMETCPDGTFTFYPNAVSQDECTPCDDDSLDCRYGTLEIQYQNWLDPASLNSTPTTYACLLTNGCSGTTYTGPNTTQCAVGYSNTMPMCSSCADGYYLVLQFCEQCTSALKSVFPLLLIIVLAVWVAMNMLADTFAAMDIFLIEVQLLAMVASFNLNFPASWVKTVVLLYNIAAFDPDIIGPECAFSMQFTGKFYATLLIPVIGLLVYALVFAHHRWLGGSFFVRVHSWQRKERQRQRLALQRSVTKRRAYNEYENSIVHASLKWLDICYVSVMVKVLQVFKSQEIGTSTVMAAAPQILWLSSAHVGMLVTAVLVTVVYLVGLPLLFAGVLVDAHTCDVLSSTLFKQRFGWLTERFRPKFWWWHLTNIGMRVLHGCILVFLQQETESQ